MLPADTFAGSAVLVTGGGTGLGRALAVEFARAGAAVGVVSRKAEHRLAGVEAVERAGGMAAEAEADVRRAEDVAAAFDAVEAAVGPVRLLVNNAAANFPVPAEDLSPNGWRAVTQIVLDGTFFCSQELFRRAHAAGEPAAIVNVLATQAFTGGPGMVHTAAAKAGVENLTKTLAVEWAPYGIRVNALAPGLFVHEEMRAELTVLRAGGDGEVDARRQPAGRLGRLHELGWAATWLCSPYASFVTGHTLVVDGANWLRRHFVMPEFVPVRTQIADALRAPGTEEQRGP
jgi:NAD(P)-dependent dehydrogenase (short-subunit alcohol dehydrogenase family)